MLWDEDCRTAGLGKTERPGKITSPFEIMPCWTCCSVERTVLSVDTVAGSHIRSDAPICQPAQELPVPIGRVGRYRFWFSFLPLRETSEHVLRGHCFLTHPCCRRLHPDDHATVIVDQIVVVVPQSGRCPTLGRVGRIW